MARSLNQVTLMGNLTRDPELRQTPNGNNVCSFSLALNRSYRDANNEWQEATDYVDIVAWGPLGERINQYLAKGRRCLVQGRLQSRSWEQDGQKRSKVEVLANDVTFLDGRNDSNEHDNDKSEKTASSNSKEQDMVADVSDEPINLDDIPF